MLLPWVWPERFSQFLPQLWLIIVLGVSVKWYLGKAKHKHDSPHAAAKLAAPTWANVGRPNTFFVNSRGNQIFYRHAVVARPPFSKWSGLD